MRCATDVCGAAAIAASAVLPKHEISDRDLAFTVMGVNFLSTVVTVVYPTLQLLAVRDGRVPGWLDP